jgi:Spy/CpxP family protein refolding chaperone
MRQALLHNTAKKSSFRFVRTTEAITYIVLAFLFTVSFFGYAQAFRHEMMAPPSAPLQRILAQLDLTEEQQSAVQSIIETDREKHRALMEEYPPESRPDRDTIKSAFDAIDQEIDGLLAEVLTTEQMEQFVTLREECQAKFPPEGFGPRGDHGPGPMPLPQR